MIEFATNYPDFIFAIIMCTLMGVVLLLEYVRDHTDDD